MTGTRYITAYLALAVVSTGKKIQSLFVGGFTKLSISSLETKCLMNKWRGSLK